MRRCGDAEGANRTVEYHGAIQPLLSLFVFAMLSESGVTHLPPTEALHRPPPRPGLEVINPDYLRGPFRCAVFDFDGTLSLVRGNWQGLMVPMMVEALAATGTGQSQSELTAIVEEFVTRLTGQPT